MGAMKTKARDERLLENIIPVKIGNDNFASGGKQKGEPQDQVREIKGEDGIKEIAKKYNTPALAQRYISENIKYDDAAYPDVKDGLNEYATFGRITKKGRGDCSEGFVVAACVLHELGYRVSGLRLTPDNGKPGHVVAVCQDPKTGLYGTAGINPQDYCRPTYKSIQELAEDVALSCQFVRATAQRLEFSEALEGNENKVTLKATPLEDIDLHKKFGVFFSEANLSFGKANYELYEDGFRISMQTIMDITKPLGQFYGKELMEGNINEIGVAVTKDGVLITFSYTIDQRRSGSLYWTIYEKNLQIIRFICDKTKMNSDMDRAYLYDDKSIRSQRGETVGDAKDIEKMFGFVKLFGDALRLESLLEHYGYDALLKSYQKHAPKEAMETNDKLAQPDIPQPKIKMEVKGPEEKK
jgi:hypothetical protein